MVPDYELYSLRISKTQNMRIKNILQRNLSKNPEKILESNLPQNGQKSKISAYDHLLDTLAELSISDNISQDLIVEKMFAHTKDVSKFRPSLLPEIYNLDLLKSYQNSKIASLNHLDSGLNTLESVSNPQ